MIKYKKKICKSCKKEKYIFSKGMCKECSRKQYKRINKISKPKSKKLNELRSIEYPKSSECFFCGEIKPLMKVHLIRRSYSEVFYSDESNIIWGCLDCHNEFDNGRLRNINIIKLTEILKRISVMDVYYAVRLLNRF